VATSEFPSRRSLFRRIAVDITPLRSARDFRLLWFGELVSETGSWMARVATYVQVYALTGSAAAVGVVGLVQLVPLVFVAIFGGPLVDRHDRRRLLLIGQIGQMASSGILLAGAVIGHPPVALVYVGAALVFGFATLSVTTRQAMIPNLVSADQLPSALALNQAMFATCIIVGPAIGGVIIDAAGLGWAYGIDVVSFAASITACLLMRPQISGGSAAEHEREVRGGAIAGGWAQTLEGLRFLRGDRVLQSTFYVDLIAMIFGMPRALFPVLAVTQFHSGSETVGLLFAAVSVGALLGALTTGWVRHIKRQGLAVLWAVTVWGGAIVAFGVSGDLLVLAMACLAVAGAADVVSAVFRGTILQQSVPDDLRGRMSAVHILVVTGGPGLGDFEAGVVASIFTPMVSVVAGGAACIVGVAALSTVVPEFARYRAPEVVDAPSRVQV
jgi:MFS family permease